MERTQIVTLNKEYNNYDGKIVKLCGWARTIRDSKAVGFLELNDGCFKGCQIVLERSKLDNYDEIVKQLTGSSFEIEGTVIVTPQARQPYEINANKVTILGTCDSDYPLQKKGHSLEFLRTLPYLRPRTNTFNAVFRIRSEAAFAIHKFFNMKHFVYLHTPIITSSDCEGAGQMFQVTTLDMDNLPKDKEGKTDYSKDFFGQKVSLTVSGQLNEECITHAFANTYTFGPTFRAENSNTSRHAAEFWMMEPEMCFTDLNGVMQNEEEMLKYVINHVMETCNDELQFLNKFIDNSLLERLNNIVNSEFFL